MNINKLILSFVFIISTIVIVSCDQQTTYEKPRIETYSGNKSLSVYKFSYEGHNYIYFFNRDHVAEGGGVIHDPECCK